MSVVESLRAGLRGHLSTLSLEAALQRHVGGYGETIANTLPVNFTPLSGQVDYAAIAAS